MIEQVGTPGTLSETGNILAVGSVIGVRHSSTQDGDQQLSLSVDFGNVPPH